MLAPNGKLLILENFLIDQTLPKFKKEMEELETYENNIGVVNSTLIDTLGDDGTVRRVIPGLRSMSRMNRRSRLRNMAWQNDLLRIQMDDEEPVGKEKEPWWKRVLGYFFHEKTNEPTLSIQEFFGHVKHSAQEISIIESRAVGYERAMLQAQNNNQAALFEQLKAGLHAYKMESHLFALGLKKYVTEDDIIKFYKQCQKGLRLDFVCNFTRQIPPEVAAQKTRADEIGVFDNYAILHFDPEAKSYAETHEQKQLRKDPILFGLIEDRRVLYFVGDWIDEYCDLTLDQIAEALGQDAVKLLPE